VKSARDTPAPAGTKRDEHPLKQAREILLILALVAILPFWLSFSPTARRNRDWKKRMVEQLGLSKGTVLKREWNGVVGLDLSVSSVRSGTPEEALAELTSAAAAEGYARDDFTTKVCTEGSLIFPPRGKELPSIWIKIIGPGQVLCGRPVPPGHTGLSANLSGSLGRAPATSGAGGR
jgi:hypothetical protein